MALERSVTIDASLEVSDAVRNKRRPQSLLSSRGDFCDARNVESTSAVAPFTNVKREICNTGC